MTPAERARELAKIEMKIAELEARIQGRQPQDCSIQAWSGDGPSPYDVVAKKYKLPFTAYQFQQNAINYMAASQASGCYADVGTGKTVMSTVVALYKKLAEGANKVIVIVPPILIRTWDDWLAKIPGITRTIYAGTPAKRKNLKLNTDFIIVSLGVFKRDFPRFLSEFENATTTVIVDEATSIKNVGSDNHKKVYEFVSRPDCNLILLTGTPLSTPIDAYAYVKMVAPGTYRSLHQFENIHVAERDFFGNVVKWGNLELLQYNMSKNSVRIRKEDVLKDLPEVTYQPIIYDLEDAHFKLYQRLADERLLILKENNTKIDATTEGALYHALQQIVLGYAHFSGNPNARPEGYNLLDEILEELNGKKLMIFSNYRRTNRELLEYLKGYGALGAYGDLTPKQSADNFHNFVNDPKCQVFVANTIAAGQGLDGAQHVCSDMLFLECPIIPKDFKQAVGRLHRTGIKNGVHVRIAVANKTVQHTLMNRMLNKDDVVTYVQKDPATLRSLIFGS